MIAKFLLKTLLLLLMSGVLLSNVQAATTLDTNPVISRFIDDMVKKHKFDKAELQQLFSDAKLLPDVIEKITRPAEAWPWHRYRNIFLKEKRINQGVEFWNENAELLARAEKKFGVPAEIIVAILGVETRFGRIKGGYRLVDSLSTLIIDYPRRSKFFRKELEHVLLLSREEKFDPSTLMGSYAGAMGKPQFMPSSYRSYAVDFDDDGVRDLLGNTADAVGSVASYLAKHGWQKNKPIATPANISGNEYKKLLKKGIRPKVKMADISQYKVSAKDNVPADLKVALIELEQKDGMEYWLGLRNFYAITRYNHSRLYAMAVYQLAESIKTKRNQVRKS